MQTLFEQYRNQRGGNRGWENCGVEAFANYANWCGIDMPIDFDVEGGIQHGFFRVLMEQYDPNFRFGPVELENLHAVLESAPPGSYIVMAGSIAQSNGEYGGHYWGLYKGHDGQWYRFDSQDLSMQVGTLAQVLDDLEPGAPVTVGTPLSVDEPPCGTDSIKKLCPKNEVLKQRPLALKPPDPRSSSPGGSIRGRGLPTANPAIPSSPRGGWSGNMRNYCSRMREALKSCACKGACKLRTAVNSPSTVNNITNGLQVIGEGGEAVSAAGRGDVPGTLGHSGLAVGGAGLALALAPEVAMVGTSMALMGTGMGLIAAGGGYALGQQIDEAGYNPFTPILCTGAEFAVDVLNDPAGALEAGLLAPPLLLYQ